ncbi:/ / hypothetical protein / 559679:560059 Reverse [Candidatus Hepatoplasma crinochetorum]|uniref:RNAP delta factor n=1 Tax=Candidatus Hepatoplasma crinochetorum TaxID=295596 RepID=A0A0G7ZLP3_9MOLU|nr:/ / hypothetical protein / 559679:560059 Reverse [Candidatus Hepatoplasma crinochetorum]
MLNVDLAINFIKENGAKKFDLIWNNIKKDLFNEIETNKKEAEIKSDFFISMINDEKLIMIGNEIWDLRENYSLKEIGVINVNVFGSQIEKEDDQELLKANDLTLDEEEDEVEDSPVFENNEEEDN